MKRLQHDHASARAARFLAAVALTATFALSVGCEALENHKCCLFSEGGLFSNKKPEVERASSKDERDALARATVESSNKKEAWEPTDSELAEARRNGIDLKKFVWTTQRPNGGALFPKQWTGPGPALVVAPSSIAAPVGTDVIVVASYIGEDSQYLRVGEQLSWNLSGVGVFTESNANDTRLGSRARSRLASNGGCLSRVFNASSEDVDARVLTTTTTDQLWRINRGTDTKLDDVTILRGQSWTSVSAFEEGTSTIVVMSDTIGNWDKRRAVSEIHWIDAAFRYPESGVAAVNAPVNLTTTICRRTTSEPRPGWIARYEVTSGAAALGPDKVKSLDVRTDVEGNATVALSQLNGAPGTCSVVVSIIRPATESAKQTVVDKREIFYTWTSSAPVTVAISASTASAQVGETINYTLSVNNLSDFYQTAIVEAILPQNATGFEFKQPLYQEGPSTARWLVQQIPPRRSEAIQFSLSKASAGPLDVSARVISASPVDAPTGQKAAPAAQTQPNASSQPPVVSSQTDPASRAPTLQ